MTRTFRLLRRLPRWVRSGLREGVETVRFLSGVVAIWFAWSSIAFATYYIPSESMQPTLEVGDRIIVSKWAYGYSRHSLPLGLGGLLPDSWDGRVGWAEPERGDVIVLQSPREDLVLIKRVVGVPGDRIEVRDGRLIINGDMVLRARTEARRYRQHNGFPPVVDVMAFEEELPGAPAHWIYERTDRHPLDDFGPILVPADHVFLMGDNRDNSVDSRAEGGPGFVPLANVIGRAETVPFTFERCDREPELHCPTGRVWRPL